LIFFIIIVVVFVLIHVLVVVTLGGSPRSFHLLRLFLSN
jgi:hypothetical protein